MNSCIKAGWFNSTSRKITLLLGAIFIIVCSEVTIEENGRMINDYGEIIPYGYPISVYSTPDIQEEAIEALDWWNEKAQRALFVYSEEGYEEWKIQTVFVSWGKIPQEDRIGSYVCRVSKNIYTSCKVVISIKAEDSLTKREISKHELGHVLGLDDDFEWALLSIMFYKLFLRAPVTNNDLSLVIEDYDRRLF